MNITKENAQYAFLELDFTHDYSKATVGSVFINRKGEAFEITKIEKDECGRKNYFCGDLCLATQFDQYHNMSSKRPYYAYEYK